MVEMHDTIESVLRKTFDDKKVHDSSQMCDQAQVCENAFGLSFSMATKS